MIYDILMIFYIFEIYDLWYDNDDDTDNDNNGDYANYDIKSDNDYTMIVSVNYDENNGSGKSCPLCLYWS